MKDLKIISSTLVSNNKFDKSLSGVVYVVSSSGIRSDSGVKIVSKGKDYLLNGEIILIGVKNDI